MKFQFNDSQQWNYTKNAILSCILYLRLNIYFTPHSGHQCENWKIISIIWIRCCLSIDINRLQYSLRWISIEDEYSSFWLTYRRIAGHWFITIKDIKLKLPADPFRPISTPFGSGVWCMGKFVACMVVSVWPKLI